MFVLGLGDRGAYHMGSKIAKRFNCFFPLSSERLYTVLGKRGTKVKHRKSLRGEGGGVGHALLCICLKDQLVSI